MTDPRDDRTAREWLKTNHLNARRCDQAMVRFVFSEKRRAMELHAETLDWLKRRIENPAA